MDVNMPVVDGLEATQIIKKMVLDKKINDVYIIITTALDKGEDRIKNLRNIRGDIEKLNRISGRNLDGLKSNKQSFIVDSNDYHSNSLKTNHV